MIPWQHLCAIALLASGLGGCLGTPTYGTGQAPEMAILNEVSGGLGLGGRKKEPINYQPRAPLVLPPSAQLRDPVKSAEVTNPEWPQDPSQRKDLTPEQREELKRYARVDSDRPRVNPLADNVPPPNANKPLEQSRKFRAALAAREGGSATERRYLTEPPLEYRAPAATAPTEFEDIKPKKKGFFSRIFGS